VQLGKTKLLKAVTHELITAVNSLQMNEDIPTSPKLIIFKTLVSQIIKDKLRLDSEAIIPSLVKWCANNGLIQTGLVIYTTQIPVFLGYKENEYRNKASRAIRKINGRLSDDDVEKRMYCDYWYLKQVRNNICHPSDDAPNENRDDIEKIEAVLKNNKYIIKNYTPEIVARELVRAVDLATKFRKNTK
jgi:hypothetical protein